MGDHPLYVRFPDGEIRHGIYRSSVDHALLELFESPEAGAAARWSRDARYYNTLDGTGSVVEAATNYGGGFYWPATATRDWLTSGWDPLGDGIHRDGLPEWLARPVICGHCHRPITQASRGIAADGAVLCHTGTIPPGDDPQDCYRLVTAYSHASDGSCCQNRPAPPWKSFADTPDDFAGCSRSGCRRTGVHSLKYGDCEYGVRPAPDFGFWRTFIAADGYPSIGMASIPLLAVLPWAKNLTVDQQHQMLEETASSSDPAETMHGWYKRACSAANREDQARLVSGDLEI